MSSVGQSDPSGNSLPENSAPSSGPEGPGPSASRGSEDGPPRDPEHTRDGSDRRRWTYIAFAVIVAVGVVVAGYAFMATRSPGSSNSMGTVLVPAGTLYSIPVDQYNAVVFAQKSPVTVEGTLTNVGGMILYVMTPIQYLHLVNTYNVSGYEWSSGPVASDTYYQLSVTIPVGSWDLVFANSVLGNTTAIGFYSNLVET